MELKKGQLLLVEIEREVAATIVGDAGMVTEQEGAGGDAKCWDEERYRKSILQERELQCRIVFRTAFAPSQNSNPEILVVASSDGSLSSYSLASCIASMSQVIDCVRVTAMSPGRCTRSSECLIKVHFLVKRSSIMFL